MSATTIPSFEPADLAWRMITFKLKWAVVAALGWTYAATRRRIVTGRPVPGLLVLATQRTTCVAMCVGP